MAVSYGSKSGETLASLREREQSVAALVKDMQRDPYVVLADRVLTANIKSAQVTVSTESPDRRTRLLASTLEAIWFRHLKQFTQVFSYGRVAQEIVWAALPGVGLDVVKSLDELPYEKTGLKLDGGEFDGITFEGWVDESGKPQHLEPLYSWWLAIDAKPLAPHGQSRYLGAMQAVWEERKEAIQRRRTFLRHYALGELILKGPQWEERDGQRVDVWREFTNSARSAEAGDVLCYDPGQETNTDGTTRPKFEIQKDSSPAKDGSPLLLITDKLGEEILLAAGIPPKTVVEGDAVGSFALVTQQMLILLATVEDLLSQIGESFQTNVVDKARHLNGVGAIKWNFTPLTQRKDDLAIELVKAWLTTPALSPILTSGAVDIPAMLDLVGIPVSADIAGRLQAMGQTAAAAQQSAQFGARLAQNLWGE